MKQEIIIYNHKTHPVWTKNYDICFAQKGCTNGAYTYSIDICKHHIPVIKSELEKTKYSKILISTVETLSPEIIVKGTDLIICYMHETIIRDMKKIEFHKDIKEKIIYIVSRQSSYKAIKSIGKDVIFLPMAIDVELLDGYRELYENKYQDKRVIYFGNKYLKKNKMYEDTKLWFQSKGWIFDEICYNRFNGGDLLTRPDILHIISKYKYGIGEGRAVLEMNALGVKTLICAGGNQGIMTSDEDFEIQKQHNYSDGNIWTFSNEIGKCIDNFDKAIIKTFDVHEVLPILQQKLKDVL